MLDAPFTLLVVHPVTFGLLMVTLYALCYVPGLVYNRATTRPVARPVPTRPRMGAWVDAPAGDVRLARAPRVCGPTCACVFCFSDKIGAYSQAHAAPSMSEVRAQAQALHTAARNPRMATADFVRLCEAAGAMIGPVSQAAKDALAQTRPHIPTWGYGEPEVPALIADTLERELAEITQARPHYVWIGEPESQASIDREVEQARVRIQHKASSTERMRAQRARLAAQGLTARGTQPLPVCEGVTRTGAACKRKAQTGVTTCSLEHAITSESEAALSLWK